MSCSSVRCKAHSAEFSEPVVRWGQSKDSSFVLVMCLIRWFREELSEIIVVNYVNAAAMIKLESCQELVFSLSFYPPRNSLFSFSDTASSLRSDPPHWRQCKYPELSYVTTMHTGFPVPAKLSLSNQVYTESKMYSFESFLSLLPPDLGRHSVGSVLPDRCWERADPNGYWLRHCPTSGTSAQSPGG